MNPVLLDDAAGGKKLDAPRAPRLQDLQWVLDNIYTLARRNLRRDPDAKDWGHVLRLCERAGCQERTVGVRRTEVPDDPR